MINRYSTNSKWIEKNGRKVDLKSMYRIEYQILFDVRKNSQCGTWCSNLYTMHN